MCSSPPALAVIAVLTVVAAGVTAAQKSYPTYTLDLFVNTMKTLGPNFAATNASIAEDDYASAKERIIRSREQLATTITFWRDNQKTDAIGFLRGALARMDELDAALSAEPVDAASVEALVGQIDAACESCHSVYREQDPVTQEYRLRPESFD